MAAAKKNPAVAVDLAVLTLPPGESTLHVLQVRREPRGWELPSVYLTSGERLADAAARALRERAGVEAPGARQVQVLEEPDRDDRGWVLSVAHVVVAPADGLDGRRPTTRLVPVDSPGRLPHGQGAIVALALEDVQRRYAAGPDPDGLLGASFTVYDLRRVHEAVAGGPLQKDTFRRLMDPHLTGTGTSAGGTRGRPAELFRRR